MMVMLMAIIMVMMMLVSASSKEPPSDLLFLRQMQWVEGWCWARSPPQLSPHVAQHASLGWSMVPGPSWGLG